MSIQSGPTRSFPQSTNIDHALTPGGLRQGLASHDPRPHEAHVEAAAPVRGPVVPHAARLAPEDGLVLLHVADAILAWGREK